MLQDSSLVYGVSVPSRVPKQTQRAAPALSRLHRACLASRKLESKGTRKKGEGRMTAITDHALHVLGPEVWLPLRAAHERRVEPWIAPRLQRGRRGEKHPVDDFLFEYYGYRPGLLRRWQPGLGVALAGQEARGYLSFSGYAEVDDAVSAAPACLSETRREGLRWLANFLEVTRARPPQYGCAGLHEWAMVFRVEQVRHDAWPLRLPAAEIERVVRRHGLRCSHYDAFRFFTSEARPLNRWQLSRERTPEREQRGCLHTNTGPLQMGPEARALRGLDLDRGLLRIGARRTRTRHAGQPVRPRRARLPAARDRNGGRTSRVRMRPARAGRSGATIAGPFAVRL